MRSESHWLNGGTVTVATALPAAQLVLVFGSGDAMANLPFETLRTTWPQAHIVGCSTAGEINDVNLRDDSLCISACHFEHSQVTFAKTNIADGQDSHSVGIDLGKQLAADGLRHVLVFTDGLNLDGTAFLAGLRGILPDGVSVTGGMAGDGTRFQRTLVCANAMGGGFAWGSLYLKWAY